MNMFQYNKLTLLQNKNKSLPLPTCTYIIPLDCSYWNQIRTGGDISTLATWEMNAVALAYQPCSYPTVHVSKIDWDA